MPSIPQFVPSGVPVEHLPETQVEENTPASMTALAQYISAQRSHIHWFGPSVAGLVMLNLVALASYWPIAIVLIPLSCYCAYRIYWWDRKRTHVVLNYELDEEEQGHFAALCAGLHSLSSVIRLGRIETRQIHGDWKHNAGATTSLTISPIRVELQTAAHWLEANVPIWRLIWKQGNLALVFLPDHVLIEQGRRVAALAYSDVRLTSSIGRFVENGSVPGDAQILGYQWQFMNKSGGPDRRFKANRQLPVTEAIYLGLQSPSGLNLLVQLSNRQRAEAFFNAFRSYRPLIIAEPSTS